MKKEEKVKEERERGRSRKREDKVEGRGSESRGQELSPKVASFEWLVSK